MPPSDLSQTDADSLPAEHTAPVEPSSPQPMPAAPSPTPDAAPEPAPQPATEPASPPSTPAATDAESPESTVDLSHVPEEFGGDLAKWGEGWKNAQTKIRQRRSEIEKEVREEIEAERAGQAPTTYVIPEALQKEVKDDDPVVQRFQEAAREVNLSQEGYAKILSAVFKGVGEFTAREEELLGPQVAERIQQVSSFLDTALGKEDAAILKATLTTADRVVAFETLMGRKLGKFNVPTGGPDVDETPGVAAPYGYIDGTPVPAEPEAAKQFLKDAQADKRYTHGGPDFDPSYRRQVGEAYKALYPENIPL